MVAYNFKQRFVTPIKIGLGDDTLLGEPKLQTIRGPRKRHARTGEEIRLSYGSRFKPRLIGMAVCTSVTPIKLNFSLFSKSDFVESIFGILTTKQHLNLFAKLDGFIDWEELRQFWAENHPGIDNFEGFLIRWEPKGDNK